MESNPRFQWSGPPAPFAVPDTTLSHLQPSSNRGPNFLFWEFSRGLRIIKDL